MDHRDRDILDFISVHPGLIPRSSVNPGRLRDSSGRLTPYFFLENVLVYVKGNFGQALHTTANINNYKCQVWHKAQTTHVVDVENLIITHNKQPNVKHFWVMMMSLP